MILSVRNPQFKSTMMMRRRMSRRRMRKMNHGALEICVARSMAGFQGIPKYYHESEDTMRRFIILPRFLCCSADWPGRIFPRMSGINVPGNRVPILMRRFIILPRFRFYTD